MDATKLHAVAAFAAGLVITLFLAAYLTPRAWWRRPNARALFIMVAGAWGFGSLILYAIGSQAAAPLTRAATRTAYVAKDEQQAPSGPAGWRNAVAGRPFHVHRDLNLRAAPGVHAARIAIVPAGADATPTGVRDGDWWQITAIIGGRETTGWASSLWLRRSGE
ncbi:hypothetical protein FHW58_001678 [Duganella sp. 1224]|uniref:SH3 domain-containing protein n=1 Tax=Duganella sp. 1224 TaxID=2587052 RepID=UPI0015C8B721|nr:SH3 domain-containing protein [Duganella sp. 1224]NYE60526.1 hypothetical protein [Duganella sp. 1224]